MLFILCPVILIPHITSNISLMMKAFFSTTYLKKEKEEEEADYDSRNIILITNKLCR